MEILRILGRQAEREVPDAWVEWRSTYGQKERKQVFLALKEEIPELVAVSLRDRDDEALESVGANLEDTYCGVIADFHARKWRRRYIESYLLWPPALAAATGIPQEEIETQLRDDHGLAVSAENFVRTDAPAALLDVRAKEILKDGDEAILRQLSVTAQDVAARIDAERSPWTS